MIRGASVIGREHVRLGRNNQDSWAFAQHEKLRAVVVTDGCSSATRSEVGAVLGAKWLAHAAVDAARLAGINRLLADSLTDALTEWLSTMTHSAAFDANSRRALIEDSFLFTFLCAVTDERRVLVFGVGDGVIAVDSKVTVLDSGPSNAPAYCAYRLLSGARIEPVIHFEGEASRVIVATDGFSSADADAQTFSFVDDGLTSANPFHLQRALNVLAVKQPFFDDATLAALSIAGDVARS